MNKLNTIWLFLAALSAANATGPAPTVEAVKLSQHVRILSSDAFEGRAPGTAGEAKTIAYPVEQYRKLGLRPGAAGGSWTQEVPLRRIEIVGSPTSSFATLAGTRSLAEGRDIVVNTHSATDKVSVQNAPLVFTGFGIDAPERGWDDFKGYDLRGKIAVVLLNDPDFEMAPSNPLFGRFDGKALTYYGRWTYKLEEAARRGAVGVLFVHEDAAATYGWNTLANSEATTQYALGKPGTPDKDPLVRGFVTHDVAVAMLKAAGMDFAVEKARAQSDAFRPEELKGVTFSTTFAVRTSVVTSHNVTAKLTGSQWPQDAVIYGAHWDHLGLGPADSRGDRIYNGALDNASGVASLLELARLFAAAPRPRRSIYFIDFTAEEQGLLGSEYYAGHPATPIATTVAVLNIDGANLKGAARDISSRGDSPLIPYLTAAAHRNGRRFTRDQAGSEGYFFRGDQFSFAKAGVPGLGYASGLDLVKGGVDAGRAWVRDYVAHRYHQPSDQWSAAMNFDGAVVDTKIYYDLGRSLASSRVWPNWDARSPFRTQRDRTAGMRR